MEVLDTKVCFMTGYIKGIEARLVDADHLGRLLRASGAKDMVAIMRDTDLGQFLEDKIPADFDEADERLWAYLGACFQLLVTLKRLPGAMAEILAAYVAKFDIANVKAALRAVAAGEKPRFVPIGALATKGSLAPLAAADSVETIAAVLAQAKQSGYASVLAAYRSPTDLRSRLRVEAELDREYYRGLLAVARRRGGGSSLVRAIRVLVDLANLQLAFRGIVGQTGSVVADLAIEGGAVLTPELTRELLGLKLAEVPGRLAGTPYHGAAVEIVEAYGRSRNVAVVEQIVERHRFALVREALSLQLLSSVLVAWYVILKEVETRNVRLLLKASFDGQSLERVKESLVAI